MLAPDRSAPVIGVAVVYDVGMRSEPLGRTGFAHLLEEERALQGIARQDLEVVGVVDVSRSVEGTAGTLAVPEMSQLL